MKTRDRAIKGHQIVSREEWTAARKGLVRKEKELTQLREERRKLPWVQVEKNYVFDGPNGKETLAELFGGRSQLVVKHFMFGPEWQEGCVPVLLGDGALLFANMDGRQTACECIRVVNSPSVNHYKYRLKRQITSVIERRKTYEKHLLQADALAARIDANSQ